MIDQEKLEIKMGDNKNHFYVNNRDLTSTDNWQDPGWVNCTWKIHQYVQISEDVIRWGESGVSINECWDDQQGDLRIQSYNDNDNFINRIALLLVLYGKKLVDDGIITKDAWEYFEQPIAEAADNNGAPEEFTRCILRRPMRYEIFWNIDLAGLLHYMVTFNTGQRKMALRVQLEIMSRPLLEELDKVAKVPIWYENEKIPGRAKTKIAFPASNLVLGTQAFLTHNAQVTGGDQAESLLEKEAYLDSFGDIQDVVTTLERIARLHEGIIKVYEDDISGNDRYILSSSDTFFLGLMASCGYIRANINMKALEGALEKLEKELERADDDPLKFDEYRTAVKTISTSRGKAMRRLVYDTFTRFFNGSTMRLEWQDTARQITG
jgi:hypothetical protein